MLTHVLRNAFSALLLTMLHSVGALAADSVSFTGTLEPAVCPAACGTCCGTYLLQDSSQQINVHVGNSFVDLSPHSGKSTLHRVTGSFYRTSGQCGLNQCTLFLVEALDKPDGAVAVYNEKEQTLEVPVATIDRKELFAVTLKPPFAIQQMTPHAAIQQMGQGQSCASPTQQCATGLSCESYYGIAGASGPQFKTCEIPCSAQGALCPLGQSCVTVADGPGQVCQTRP
jgi:hypothetical protein